MPITPDRSVSGALVENYFDNLLPADERIRRRIGMRFGTDATAAFELLQAIGRDGVGAVHLLPPEIAPDGFDRLSYTPITDADDGRRCRTQFAGRRRWGRVTRAGRTGSPCACAALASAASGISTIGLERYT